ncbi:MAG: UbiA family prenyltransferase, partial [Cellvibrionales bacterium]|nr:UbiA family prenyltransferase [Cellvibrionales bacterium]
MMKKSLSTSRAILQKHSPAFKDYYQLSKPGIIFGNLLSSLGGFYLASNPPINLTQLIAILVGIGLVVGSGCVVNNFYDRDIDALMDRTKNRPLILNPKPLKNIMLFSGIQGTIGLYLILLFGNVLACGIAILGWLVYVILYTVWLKRSSSISTIVGSISGAAPPVIAYCAVSGTWNLDASLLFLLFVLGQMPHHYA